MNSAAKRGLNKTIDEWCEKMSGTVYLDEEQNSVMMVVKEALTQPHESGRKYRMRLFNVTYQTIGSADEDRIRMHLGKESARIVGKFMPQETKAGEFLKALKAARTMACTYGGD